MRDGGLKQYLVRYQRNELLGKATRSFPNPLLSKDIIGNERQRLTRLFEELQTRGYLSPMYKTKKSESHIIKGFKVVNLDALLELFELPSIMNQTQSALQYLEKGLERWPNCQPAICEVIAAISSNRTWLKYKADNIEEIAPLFDMVEAILDGQAQGETFRSFSAKCSDRTQSKTFEALFQKVLHALTIITNCSREQVIDLCGFINEQTPPFMSGPLKVLISNGSEVDFSFLPYFALPQNTNINTSSVEDVLTIENWYSFTSYCNHHKPEGRLVIYTGGFLNTSAKSLLRDILESNPVPLYHWGDIDPSGLVIAADIQRSLAHPVSLAWMNMDILKKHGKTSLRPRQKVALNKAREVKGSDELVEYFLSGGNLWVEQESLPNDIFSSLQT